MNFQFAVILIFLMFVSVIAFKFVPKSYTQRATFKPDADFTYSSRDTFLSSSVFPVPENNFDNNKRDNDKPYTLETIADFTIFSFSLAFFLIHYLIYSINLAYDLFH